MKILVADDDIALSTALVRVLESAGHDVESVSDGLKALERLNGPPIDLLVTDWLMPGLDGLGLLRHVRSKLSYRCAVMIHSGLSQSAAKTFALESGADAYLCKPAPPRVFLDMLNAVARRIPKVPAESATSSAHQTIMGSSMWTEFDAQVAKVLGECTALTLLPSHAPSVDSDFEMGSSLAMVDSKRQLELHVGIQCSLDSASVLARSLLRIQTAEQEMLWDMLGELCNNLVGFAKMSLREENFSFTLGIPIRRRGAAPHVPYDATTSTLLGAGAVRLFVEAGVRRAPTCIIKACALRENMIVVEDVKNDAGVLLVPAGTLITEATAERITRHGSKRDIRVASFVGT